MALSDLAVFSEYVQSSAVAVSYQQAELFNAKSAGGIVLRTGNLRGDYSDTALWARLQGLVRRRNAYGSGDVAEINLSMLTENMVKVAAGTPPVRIDPSMFRWIQKSPEEAGAMIGQQLAEDMILDMFNTALLVLVASHSQVPGIITDITAEGDGTAKFKSFNRAQRPFGDRADRIAAWLMHSKVGFDIYENNLANAENLFTFGDVVVRRDPFGRVLISADAPAFINQNADPELVTYNTVGVTPGAVIIERNNDFDDNTSALNGKENIKKTYQAEWSYNVGVQAFGWDKAAGGKSPTDSALGTATNWDRYGGGYSNDKMLGAVILKSK